MIRYSLVAVIVFAWATSTTAVIPAVAQQSPFKPPSNLRVLPKDTKLAEIIPTMKSFTQALGVRCQFCHSYKGSDPDVLENFDFAGDTLPAKATARKMMAIVKMIDAELRKSGDAAATSGELKVTCYTCHRGERTPQTSRGPGR